MELLTEQQISVEMINNFSDEETTLSFISLASDTDVPTTVAPNYVETTSDAPTFIAQEPCTSTSQALPSRNETVSLSRAAHVVFSQEAGLSSVEASHLVSLLSPFLHHHHHLLFLHLLLLISLRHRFHLILKPMTRNQLIIRN